MIHVVLVEPQIPPNTGNIARFCAALSCRLHLIHPLGFSLEDRYLKRAGLDYWPHVELYQHESLNHFLNSYPQGHFYYLTTKSNRPYTSASFKEGDFLFFGSETKGLPDKLLQANLEKTLTIPMTGSVRSLNLSSSVAIVASEALRQIRLEGERVR